MRKRAVIISAAAVVVALSAVAVVPKAVENSVPVTETLRASVREYSETVCGSGSVSFVGQNEITSSLPLVLDKFLVNIGDEINVGEEIAVVDKKSSEALIKSLGQVKALAIPAASLETAVAMIPESISSDCNGKVVATASCGTAIQSGSSIASVSQSEQLSVSAAISELEIAKISLGQKARITLSAYPESVFTGTVSEIAQTARKRYSGSVLETVVDVSIIFDRADERLKSGLSADVEIELGEPRKICVVPYAAVGQDDNGEYVCVYEDGKAVRRDIKTGAEFSDGTEVVSGIDGNEILLKEPDKITNKSNIRIDE